MQTEIKQSVVIQAKVTEKKLKVSLTFLIYL